MSGETLEITFKLVGLVILSITILYSIVRWGYKQYSLKEDEVEELQEKYSELKERRQKEVVEEVKGHIQALERKLSASILNLQTKVSGIEKIVQEISFTHESLKTVASELSETLSDTKEQLVLIKVHTQDIERRVQGKIIDLDKEIQATPETRIINLGKDLIMIKCKKVQSNKPS